jgi:hypothetical protein
MDSGANDVEDIDRASHPSRLRWRAGSVVKPSREDKSTRQGEDDGEFIELLARAQDNAHDAVRETSEKGRPLDAAGAVHTLRSLQQTGQEDRAFSARLRHDQQLFELKLLMARSAYVLLIGIALVASYVIVNHRAFSTAVVAEAGTTLLVQTAGLMAWSWRVVLAREEPELTPLTIATLDVRGNSAPPALARDDGDVSALPSTH